MTDETNIIRELVDVLGECVAWIETGKEEKITGSAKGVRTLGAGLGLIAKGKAAIRKAEALGGNHDTTNP